MPLTIRLPVTEVNIVVVEVDVEEDEAMVDEAEVEDTHLRRETGPVLIPRVAMLILLGGRVVTGVEWTNLLTRGDPREASRLGQALRRKAKACSQLTTGSVASAAMSTGRGGRPATCATDPSSQWKRSEQDLGEVLTSAELLSTKLRLERRATMSLMIWAGRRRNTRCRTRNP